MVRVVASILFASLVAAAHAQDTKAWLDTQGLEAADTKTVGDLDVVVARVPGAKDLAGAQMRVVVLKAGKPLWQSSTKDADPGSKWTIHSAGKDLDGDGQPDVHVSSFSGTGACCTTHHVLRLKPQVKKTATYSAGNVAGGEFIEIPGRKLPVMVSADDSSANAFAPYASSYFPLVILEVNPKGRFEFAKDLMQSKLPGQPPPVCAQPAATANPWLKERCNEFITTRRNARTADIKSRLAEIKSTRSADKLTWENYYATGVLSAVSAEMNRYTYTGHGAAGGNWMETVWPGNDAIKLRFVQTLRTVQGKSVFAEDLRALAAQY
jgi:hypothetical protein